MADEGLSDAIEQAATEPKSAMVDGRAATSRSLDELIKADQHLAEKRTQSNGGLGIRFIQQVPGGCG